MAIDRRFLPIMAERVTVYARTGSDMYGQGSYSTSGTTYPAHVSYGGWDRRHRNNYTNEAIEDKTTIWLLSTGEITADAKVVLPDGSSPKILQSHAIGGVIGIHHVKLICGE